MEGAFAAGVELTAKFGGHGSSDQLTSRRQVVETLEQIVEPLGNGRAAGRCKTAGSSDVRQRQDARYNLDVDARCRRVIAEAEEAIGREKELRDRAIGARVDLALEVFEIELTGREEPVGLFAVDLFGREIQTGHAAIIENQLAPA